MAVFHNEFGIVLDTSGYGAELVSMHDYPLTYAGIRRWIEDNYNVKISKSSIAAVKNKCNVSIIDFNAGKEPDTKNIGFEKEKFVLEAFKAFGIVWHLLYKIKWDVLESVIDK